MPSFTRKNDLVCWTFLSEDQQRIYEQFATSKEVREVGALYESYLESRSYQTIYCFASTNEIFCLCLFPASENDEVSFGGADSPEENLRSSAPAVKQTVSQVGS